MRGRTGEGGRPGFTAGWKLAGLALLGCIVLATQSLPALCGLTGLGVAASLWWTGARQSASVAVSGVMLSVLAAAGFAGSVEGAEAALAVLLRFSTLIAFAHVLTATTRSTEIEAGIVAGLRPLERMPFVSAEKVGLAVALAVRSLPRMRDAVHAIREAHAARGLKTATYRFVLPLMARTLHDADAIAEAIDARCWPPASGGTEA